MDSPGFGSVVQDGGSGVVDIRGTSGVAGGGLTNINAPGNWGKQFVLTSVR